MSGSKAYFYGIMVTFGYSTYLQKQYPKSYELYIPSMDAVLWPAMLPILIGKHLRVLTRI